MKDEFLKPLLDFLEIPSVSTQEQYINDMENARKYLDRLFRSFGFKTKILKGIKHDAIYASLTINDKLPTVLIYGHYDVQPPEPLDEWKNPPFKPTIKGDQLFARGSSDNKGQVMIHIMAVKRLLEENKKIPINFKFIIEGEEEVGSPSIQNFAKKYSSNLLKSDYLIVSDTDMPKRNQPSIDISLRGLLYTEVEVQTAKHDLHSGEFGGVAENPIILLARAISKLKDEKGRIKIPKFYDDVSLSLKQKVETIKLQSKSQEEIIKEGELYGIGGGELQYSLGERISIRPTLDINGISGGYQGEGSKTIIPYKASAKISMRLVPNQKPAKIYKNFERYIKTLFPNWVKVKIIKHADCLPYIAPTNDSVFTLMKQSLRKIYKKEPVFKGVGGSIGFVPIMAKALRVPVVMVGFALPGSNIHAPNEYFRLSNYYKGIEVMTDFYKRLLEIKN